MFLAVDTVFEQCSVAIVAQDSNVLSCHTEQGKREQTQHILPMIDAALQQNKLVLSDITSLVFNRGPGAFSGIRINTAVIQALSVAHDIPCVGISSLAALAQFAFETHDFEHVYTALDARMQQVYFGEYKLANVDSHRVMQLADGATEQLLDYGTTVEPILPVVGNGAALLALPNNKEVANPTQQNNLQQEVETVWPDATIIAKLGMVQYLSQGGVSADQALPVYLRHNAWKTLKEQGKA